MKIFDIVGNYTGLISDKIIPSFMFTLVHIGRYNSDTF